jgi:hypothetical protein
MSRAGDILAAVDMVNVQEKRGGCGGAVTWISHARTSREMGVCAAAAQLVAQRRRKGLAVHTLEVISHYTATSKILGHTAP